LIKNENNGIMNKMMKSKIYMIQYQS